MAFAWTRTSAGPSFPSDAFTCSTYSSSETNTLSKAGLVGFRPRDSLPKPCSLACLRHSLKVDSLMRLVIKSCASMLIVAPIPVSWPGKVNTCQYLHHTRQTCENACITVRTRKGYLRFSARKTATRRTCRSGLSTFHPKTAFRLIFRVQDHFHT